MAAGGIAKVAVKGAIQTSFPALAGRLLGWGQSAWCCGLQGPCCLRLRWRQSACLGSQSGCLFLPGGSGCLLESLPRGCRTV